MPIVKALLVIAKDESGNSVYLYQGTEVPASIPASELERLADYFSADESPEVKAEKPKTASK